MNNDTITVTMEKEAYEKPLVIEYDSPTVSFTTCWDKSGYSS